MDCIYARELLPHAAPNSIFLVGPTPRGEIGVSWRPEAMDLLKKRGFSGTVLIPEDRPDADGTVHFRGDYDGQIAWEREALQRATVILAWVPRDLETMPAFTTNVEWGMWWDSGKIVFGAPLSAPKNNYLKWYAGLGDVPMAVTLEDTVDHALALLAQFADDDERCVFCKIAHQDPHGQIVQRWDHAVAFEPLNPCVSGHMLVVPTRHVAHAAENPGVTADAYRAAAAFVRRQGYQANLITSIGADATQTVQHLHIHVIPRSADDGVLLPWSHQAV